MPIKKNEVASHIQKLCEEKGVKLTSNRLLVAEVIYNATDHPDVEEVYHRAQKINPDIGIATVYRTVKLLEEAGVVTGHDFENRGKTRYEKLEEDHHDHLIDIASNKVIEFFDKELEALKEKIARDHGYKLVGHRLELYCRPLAKKSS